MSGLLLSAAGVSAATSIIIILLLLLKKAGTRFTAKSRYLIWSLVMLRLLIPAGSPFGEPLVEISIPQPAPEVSAQTAPESPPSSGIVQTASSESGASGASGASGSTGTQASTVMSGATGASGASGASGSTGTQASTVMSGATGASGASGATGATGASGSPVKAEGAQDFSVTPVGVLSLIWLAGAALFFALKLAGHLLCMRTLRASLRPASPEISDCCAAICRQKGIRRPPAVYISSGTASPMLAGLPAPKVILPLLKPDAQALEAILAHELVHYRRGDLFVKLFALAAVSLNWWNPFAHIAFARMTQEMELSCDEEVLRGKDESDRLVYGKALLEVVKSCTGRGAALTTHFNPRRGAAKERFYSIFDSSRKRRGIAIIVTAALLCVIAGGVFGCKIAETDDARTADVYALLDYMDALVRYVNEPVTPETLYDIDLTYFIFWQARLSGDTVTGFTEAAEGGQIQRHTLAESNFTAYLEDCFGIDSTYIERYAGYTFLNENDGRSGGDFYFAASDAGRGDDCTLERTGAEITVGESIITVTALLHTPDGDRTAAYRFDVLSESEKCPWRLLSVSEGEIPETEELMLVSGGEGCAAPWFSIVRDGAREYMPVSPAKTGVVPFTPIQYNGDMFVDCAGIVDGTAYLNVRCGGVTDVYIYDIEAHEGSWMSGASDFETWHNAKISRIAQAAAVGEAHFSFCENYIISFSPDNSRVLLRRSGELLSQSGGYYIRELESGAELAVCDSFTAQAIISWMDEYSEWMEDGSLRIGVWTGGSDSPRKMTVYDVLQENGEWSVLLTDYTGYGTDWFTHEQEEGAESLPGTRPDVSEAGETVIADSGAGSVSVIPPRDFEIYGEQEPHTGRLFDAAASYAASKFGNGTVIRLYSLISFSGSFAGNETGSGDGKGTVSLYYDYFREGDDICAATKCGGGVFVIEFSGEGEAQSYTVVENDAIGSVSTYSEYEPAGIPEGAQQLVLDMDNRVYIRQPGGTKIATPAYYYGRISSLETCFTLTADTGRLMLSGQSSDFYNEEFHVYTSFDTGASWSASTLDYSPVTTEALFPVTDVVISFPDADNGAIILGTNRAELFIYRSFDGGASWSRVSNFKLLNYRISAAVTGGFVSGDLGIICLGATEGDNPNIYVSRDGGVNWSRLDIMMPDGYDGDRRVRGLAPYLDGEAVIIPVSANEGILDIVLRSEDQGQSWSWQN